MLRRSLSALALSLLLSFPASAQPTHAATPWPTFATPGEHFTRDGKPYQIISGAIHFQRIPRAGETLDVDGVTLRVLDADRRVVKRVAVRAPNAA